jgi:hypothetical protein
VTDEQNPCLFKLGMDVNTVRTYLADGRLPSEATPERNWRTCCQR